MTLERRDGSVYLHKALLTPSRHLISGMDRNRFFLHLAAWIVGMIMCLAVASLTSAYRTMGLIAVGITLGTMYALVFLRRLGQKGGYYHAVYQRRIREQEVYPRSTPAYARPRAENRRPR